MDNPSRKIEAMGGGGQADNRPLVAPAEAGVLPPEKIALLQVVGFVDATVNLLPAQRQEKLFKLMPDISRLIARIMTELMADLHPANVDIEYLKRIIQSLGRYEAIQNDLAIFIEQVVEVETKRQKQATTDNDLHRIFDRLLALSQVIERNFPVNVSGLATSLSQAVNKMRELAQDCVSKSQSI